MRAARRLSIRLAEPAPGRADGPGLQVRTRCGRSNPGDLRQVRPPCCRFRACAHAIGCRTETGPPRRARGREWLDVSGRGGPHEHRPVAWAAASAAAARTLPFWLVGDECTACAWERNHEAERAFVPVGGGEAATPMSTHSDQGIVARSPTPGAARTRRRSASWAGPDDPASARRALSECPSPRSDHSSAGPSETENAARHGRPVRPGRRGPTTVREGAGVPR